jgi:signal transduction histidine kinase/ligand-binding sensor domain-containing protein
MRLIRTLLVAAILLQPFTALAADPGRRLAEYTHQRWDGESAVPAPVPVVAMAQGRDGFIWLASDQGLFRFDGIGFERIESEGNADRNDPPSAVLAARNGDIWIALKRSHRFAVYQAGRLRLVNMPAAPGPVMALAEGPDGAVWALTANHNAEVLRIAGGRWQQFGAAQGVPRDDALSLFVAADGATWVSLCNSVVRLPPGAAKFELVRETPRANGRLSQDPAGRVWLSERGGSYPLTGPGGRGSPPPLRAPYRTDDALIRGAPMFDRVGNLWIATRYDGVERIASPAPTGPPSPAAPSAQPEHFRNGDGLSSGVTYQLLEDREGNVWIATEKGLDRMRPATLRAAPALTDPAAFGDKLMTAADGSVYIGQARTIYRVRPGGDPVPMLKDINEPQSLCEAPDGSIWIGFSTQILVWAQGRIRQRIARPEVHSIIYDCAFDARGDYWISAAAGGLHRYHHGRWERMFGPTRVDGFTPMTMVRDSRGRLIVQWTLRSLAWIDHPTPSFMPLDLGLAEPNAVTLYPGPGGDIFAAGTFGLSRFRDGRVRTLRAVSAPEGSRINGMVQTPEGETWLAYPRALVGIRTQDLDRALSDPGFALPRLSLGSGDGLTSRPHSMSQLALVRGGDGRLWIATETGTLWMDPRQILRNGLPPPLAIKSLTAGGRAYRDPVSLRLPAGTSNLQIDFAALSFADPRQVNVRYRLDGFDETWSDAGPRRQAFYTNLPPGRYRFQVIAANDAGVWNRTGASVDVDIPPTFLQSRWFLALCGILALVLLWLIYRLRMAQVARGIRSRLEERLGERERIARELHDTLLQSVQGLILRFQSVANKMPAEGSSRTHLEAALKRADEVIADGRNRVQDLRVADGSTDLAELLRERAVEAGFDPPIPIRIVVEGRPRPIHALVSVELGRIAGEALFNAARHAKANSVEITIRFAARQLGVEIRDDGIGIAEDVLEKGHRPGHFGLTGMRERAERIGGSFSIGSRPGIGSTVTMTLPARLAFADQTPRRGLFARLFPRRKEPNRA